MRIVLVNIEKLVSKKENIQKVKLPNVDFDNWESKKGNTEKIEW